MGTDTNNSTTAASSGLNDIIKHTRTLSLVIYCMVFIVGTLGNGLVIYVTGFRMKRTVNSVWFLNLALADFLFTGFLIFSIVSLLQQGSWPFGSFMCKLNTFVSTVNMFASVFLLAAISLDRCFSIWMVVWAQNHRTVVKAQIISAAIWVAAGVCSTPYASFRSISEMNGAWWCGYFNPTAEQKKTLYIFRFVGGFLIPFLAIFVSYVAIAIRARNLQKTRKQRSRRIIFSVIFAFFICWLPVHVIYFIELQSHGNPAYQGIVRVGGNLAVSLAFMNSCLNPILYVFMCDEFQKKLKKSICFVLESALAEDHLSLISPRSLSSHFSRMSRKSDSALPTEKKDTANTLIFTECQAVFTDETGSS